VGGRKRKKRGLPIPERRRVELRKEYHDSLQTAPISNTVVEDDDSQQKRSISERTNGDVKSTPDDDFRPTPQPREPIREKTDWGKIIAAVGGLLAIIGILVTGVYKYSVLETKQNSLERKIEHQGTTHNNEIHIIKEELKDEIERAENRTNDDIHRLNERLDSILTPKKGR
jgi:hypothetical protein